MRTEPLRPLTGLLGAALILQGCVSTAPRAYTPTLQPPAADQADLERAFASCANRVAAGERHFGGGGVTTAVAAGAGTLAAGEMLGLGALYGAYDAAGAGILAATGVGIAILVPLGTLQMTRSRRAGNERAVQGLMSACLQEAGYHVQSWSRVDPAAPTTLATPTRRAPHPRAGS